MRKWRPWLIGIAIAIVAVLAFIAMAAIHLEPRVKKKTEKMLSEHFHRPVHIQSLQVRLFPVTWVDADGVTIGQPVNGTASGSGKVPPLISIQHFSARTNWASLLLNAKPDIHYVKLQGLRITIAPGPPSSASSPPAPAHPKPTGQKGGKKEIPFTIEKIVANGAVLVILPKTAGGTPLEWDMKDLSLDSIGHGQPMRFVTVLTNAKPPGLIHCTGTFGPWVVDNPGQTELSGKYSFHDANLGVFSGISGTLTSDGQFHGQLDRIEAKGATDTPDFRVGHGHPVDLKANFSATIDGTSGDTYLHPVDAHFGQSEFLAKGSVAGKPNEKGKSTTLEVATDHARIEDILRLVLGDDKTPLRGAIHFQSKFVLPPGNASVLDRLYLKGKFGLPSTHFSSSKLQDKLDTLSGRSRGVNKPKQQPDVDSQMRGQFTLQNGSLRLSHLSFKVPGIDVQLHGTYGLKSEKIDFHGKARLQGTLSQMTTGWKSLLLKLADPFFEKNGAGAVLPIKVTGTKSHPHFGLDGLP